MRSLAFILLTALAFPATAQDVIPDTLDWREYYPLQVGNVWEWYVEVWIDGYYITRWEIVGDTTLNGTNHFVRLVTGYVTDRDRSFLGYGGEPSIEYLRYDTARAMVVRFFPEYEIERDVTVCPLSADFGATISCDGLDGITTVLGGYDGHDGLYGQVSIGYDLVDVRAWKGIEHYPFFETYFYGIGWDSWSFEGTSGNAYFEYVKVGENEYGTSIVATVGSAVDMLGESPAGDLVIYPNPSWLRTTVYFRISDAGNVALDVIDLLGRKLQTIADDFYYPGRHTITMNASSLPAGVYFVRLRAGDRVETRSLVVAH